MRNDKKQNDRKSAGFVLVRGAREHNLKNVDLDVPRDALVVFSGVSGSGKSSLAFGTLYAEAQRRYLESVAPYARRLMDQVGVPAVDSIDGLPPAIALHQQRGSPNARSSVGSVTTLSSLLRMLYSRAGSYPPGQPMLFAEDFSPNSPQGACPGCHGLGHVFEVTEETMVPDPTLTIRDRAVAAWPPAWHGQNLRDILVSLGHDIDKPWHKLPRKTRDWILYTEEQPTVPVYAGFSPEETREALASGLAPSYQGTFMGARRYVLHTFATTQSAQMKRRVSRFMRPSLCPQCKGKRLKRESLSVKFADLDLAEMSALPLQRLVEILRPAVDARMDEERLPAPIDAAARKASAAAERARRLSAGGAAHDASPDVRRTPNLSEEKRIAAQRIASAVSQRVETLVGLGLGYLSLDRSTPTLSPGELQRLRLATQIRSNLFGVVYVLDEPSAGLHPADAESLYAAFDALKQAGNTLFVVEHDLHLIRRADWLVDVGPDAGEKGGRILYSGPPEGLQDVTASHTARYLFGAAPAARDARAQARVARDYLRLEGIRHNNLHGVDAAFPIGALTTVTGVSGSGKSSLVSHALVDLVSAHLGQEVAREEQGDGEGEGPVSPMLAAGRLAGGQDAIRRLVVVDQKPIGRTPRSNLATYTGLFDDVRKLFASTRAARARRYDAGRFSFNVAKGRCDTCEGEGFVSVEMLFMPSVYAPCPKCHGARYNEATLRILWNGKSIADVLGLTVEAARAFFADQPSIARSLSVLEDIGLGYLRLGQPATELSGGEAQRIKLGTELQRSQRGSTLYVLDEPTTGLHPADVDRLMRQLHALVDARNTVVLVEHDVRVMAQSDWIIDLGPGAGAEGGRIVASGTVETVVANKLSRTAPYLREAWAQRV
ncbi:excinuclease ABC subunit UvrA [Ramlibacter sp. AN1015]|uniref:excinuclease ABC subunit UvrA n=1 Tax=Ramlibacter sp. AN1015 TaxID=3133428 RepID=UPI0030BEB440